jgi:hypothetical protein
MTGRGRAFMSLTMRKSPPRNCRTSDCDIAERGNSTGGDAPRGLSLQWASLIPAYASSTAAKVMAIRALDRVGLSIFISRYARFRRPVHGFFASRKVGLPIQRLIRAFASTPALYSKVQILSNWLTLTGGYTQNPLF